MTRTQHTPVAATKIRRRFSAGFKAKAVRLASRRGASLYDIAQRLGISERALSNWVKQDAASADGAGPSFEDQHEIRRLRGELRRVTTERDILKRAAAFFARGGSDRYAFVHTQAKRFPVVKLCELLQVSRGGLYFWRTKRAGRQAHE
ncbi:MAG: transposase [Nannocystaceae bacterium]